MEITEIQKKILNDDKFLLSEIRKVQELYKLKNEIRWDQTRTDENLTESVAEHIFGMHVVADYFLPLEDPEHTWDWAKVHDMITWHDLDEVEIGDIISLRKTEAQMARERDIAQKVIDRMPLHMQKAVSVTLDEYIERQSPEAKFVKAIDKAEPVFELYRDGFGEVLKSIDRKYSQWDSIITKHVTSFPYINRFTDFVHEAANREGFFAAE